jgi:hypothetical protein
VDSGHAFLCLGKESCDGFYPASPNDWASWKPGAFMDDTDHPYTASMRFKVCPETMKKIKEKIASSKKAPPIYFVGDYDLNNPYAQCTTWVLEMLNGGGISFPPNINEPCELARLPGFKAKPPPAKTPPVETPPNGDRGIQDLLGQPIRPGVRPF